MIRHAATALPALVISALVLAWPLAAHEPGTPAGGDWPAAGAAVVDTRPVVLDRYAALGGPFALRGTDGRAVRLEDFRGQVVLMFFGYTSCPDACPLTVAKVTQALGLLGDQRRHVRFLFVTTDPQRDTPERLRAWLAGFDASFVGLRGSAAEIAAVEKRYGAFHIGLPKSAEGGYQVNHTSRLFLIDREGSLRYLFRPDQPAEAIADGVRQILQPRPWWSWFADLIPSREKPARSAAQ